MYRRRAELDEDMSYSLMGLLETLDMLQAGVNRDNIRSNIGVRQATGVLAKAMHPDKLLLLTVIETCHGAPESPLDG